MKDRLETAAHRRWFTVGMAISLSVATFASPIGREMDQPWRADGKAIDDSFSLGAAAGLNSGTGLRLASRVSRQPWSGPWWATSTGSIAIRWRTALIRNGGRRDWPSYQQSGALAYAPYSADELAGMTEEQIREWTSAVEKLDIVAENTVPGSKRYYRNLEEVRAYVRAVVAKAPEQLGYHGVCNGFAHAAIWLPEPDQVRVPARITLSDGTTKTIVVGFGSADMKALASYYYGRRTATEGPYQAAMTDHGVNPAAFHLLLTNLVADADQSFVVDAENGDEVWNYPVVGFEFTANRSIAGVSRGADPRAVKEVQVVADVDFQKETNPYQEPIGLFPQPSAGFYFLRKTYRYRLELTSDDKIVGGSWGASSDRPDFAWTLKGKIPFTGDYSFLERYWRAAR